MYAQGSEYGASNYRGLRDANRLAWDICENDIWFIPSKFEGFSVSRLIDLGVLQDAVNASCRMYKNAPLSNTYIEITLTDRKPDYFRDAVGAYEDVNLTAYSINFRFVVNNTNIGNIAYGIEGFDGAVCEYTKYDGTVGLGVCVQGMNRNPSYEQGGNPDYIRTGQHSNSNENIFPLLEYFFGDE